MADDDVHVHVDYAKQHVPEEGPDICPKCRVLAEGGYGLAGGGVGVYMYCPKCGDVLSKTQDRE